MIVFSRSVLARALAAPAFALALAVPPHALAQGAATATSSYSIAAGPLEDSLNRFGRTAGITLSFAPEMTAGLRSGGLQGSHTLEEGLRHLLAGSGVEALRQTKRSYVLRRVPPAGSGQVQTMREIRVQDSLDADNARHAGGQVASGARVGMMGKRAIMDTPFNINSYTSELIEKKQARGLMDVLENDPSVRSSAPIVERSGYRDSAQLRDVKKRGDDRRIERNKKKKRKSDRIDKKSRSDKKKKSDVEKNKKMKIIKKRIDKLCNKKRRKKKKRAIKKKIKIVLKKKSKNKNEIRIRRKKEVRRAPEKKIKKKKKRNKK